MAEEITEIESLLNSRSMLAWISYPPHASGFCFAYPQWLCEGGSFTHINEKCIPDRGALFVSLQGYEGSSQVKSKYGELAVIKLNHRRSSEIVNREYDPVEKPDRYFLMYNENWTGSGIEFESLQDNSLRRELMHIVEIEDTDVSLDKPADRSVKLILEAGEQFTQEIMIERTEGAQIYYYGPFNAQLQPSGEYTLEATSSSRKKIYKINAMDVEEIAVRRSQFASNSLVAKFMDRGDLNSIKKNKRYEKSFDWITDQELIDAVGAILGKVQNLKLNPADIESIKSALSEIGSAGTTILDNERKQRIAALLQQPKLWKEKIDLLSVALANPQTQDMLIDLAMSDENFPRFKDLLADNDKFKMQLEDDRRKYDARAKEAQKRCEELEKKEKEARRRVEQTKLEAEELRREALADVQQELDQKTALASSLDCAINDAKADLAALEEKAETAIAEFDEQAAHTVDRLLERRVVARLATLQTPCCIAAENDRDTNSGRKTPAPRADEEQLEDLQVLEAIHELVATRSGRPEIKQEDVLNLLVCLMGSSITVLSGLPGTGKTSLATILAGALGLNAPETNRFTKIPVERGWTSHRDYIGYHNPLTGNLEASNSSIFEDMVALDRECREAGTPNGVTPQSIMHLMLLDEANLSVVENYWSPFLSNADEFMFNPTKLSMQGGRPLMPPANVRWIATVNYDHTTEALSDRFLNRAWVINIEGGSRTLDSIMSSSSEHDYNDVQPFSYDRLFRAFGPKENARIQSTTLKNKLLKLFQICADEGKPVSYRCQRAIAHYIATVEPMLVELGEPATHCLDFAVAQRVLPSLGGFGGKTLGLLQKLEEECIGLPKTKAHITRMINAGETDGFYQFFV